MSDKSIHLQPGEEILVRSRPAWRSFWVFFLGLVICVFGPLVRENPPLSLQTGLLFGAVFALIILRRWSDVYTLTNRRIMVRGGLFARDTTEIRLADVAGIEYHQGINLRLVNAGHIYIRSGLPDQENIMMYGQRDPQGFKERLDRLLNEVKGRSGREAEIEEA